MKINGPGSALPDTGPVPAPRPPDRRLQRLAGLGAIFLAAGASIATSKVDHAVEGFATDASLKLTATRPVQTFNVTVDINAQANQDSSGARRSLDITPMLSATTDFGGEVAVTISPGGTQPRTMFLRGRETETLVIGATSDFFASCQDGKPCVVQGSVRFELQTGAGAQGSFMVHARTRKDVDEPPPAGAAIKVTIAEQAP